MYLLSLFFNFQIHVFTGQICSIWPSTNLGIIKVYLLSSHMLNGVVHDWSKRKSLKNVALKNHLEYGYTSISLEFSSFR